MRTWAALLIVLLAAGCLDNAPGVGLDTGAANSVLAPDCSWPGIQRPERGFCGRFLAPGPGRHLEASLRAHPHDADTVLVTWTERLAGTAKVWSSITTDGGANWRTTYMHDPALLTPPLANPPYGFDAIAEFDRQGNAIVFFGGEGVHYVRSFTGNDYVYVAVSDRMTLATSRDGGGSWSYRALHTDPVEGLLIATDFMDLGVSPDSGHMVVAAHTFRSVPASAGVYTPVVPLDTGLYEYAGTYVWTSADGGATWSPGRALEPGAPGHYYAVPRVSFGPEGLVVVTAVRMSGLWSIPDPTRAFHGMYVLVSRDHGRTFGEHTIIDGPSGDEYHGLGAPVIHAAPDGQRIDIVLNALEKVLLVRSNDDGKTWSTPTPVASGPSDTWNWWSIPTSDRRGGLHILSLYSNLCTDEAATDLRWGMQLHAHSDQGAASVNLTEEWSRAPTGCWASNDYGGVDVAVDGAVWAAWSDPRVHESQPHIAIARLVRS